MSPESPNSPPNPEPEVSQPTEEQILEKVYEIWLQRLSMNATEDWQEAKRLLAKEREATQASVSQQGNLPEPQQKLSKWERLNKWSGAFQSIGAIGTIFGAISTLVLTVVLFDVSQDIKQADDQRARETRGQAAVANYFNQLSTILTQLDLEENSEKNSEDSSKNLRLQTFLAASTVTLLRDPDLNFQETSDSQSFLKRFFQFSSLGNLALIPQENQEAANPQNKNSDACPIRRNERKGDVIRQLIKAKLVQSDDATDSSENIQSETGKRPIISLDSANLKQACLSNADLVGAVLSRAELIDASLNKSELQNADLRSANLTNADLREAYLTRAALNEYSSVLNCCYISIAGAASLINAKLQQATLVEANLTGANLTRADLTFANLVGANLTNADLTNTVFIGAALAGVDLTNADLTNTVFYGIPEAHYHQSYQEDFATPDSLNPNPGQTSTPLKESSEVSHEARGLTPEQIKAATNWEKAIYSPEFRQRLGLPVDPLIQKSGR